MFQTKESVGEITMVTNIELEKKVIEQEEENRFLKNRLAQLEEKVNQVEETTKEVKGKAKGNKK